MTDLQAPSTGEITTSTAAPNAETPATAPATTVIQPATKEGFWQLVREGKELEAWHLLESEIKAKL